MTIDLHDIPVTSTQDPVSPYLVRPCPHLGVINDPDTIISYPADANHCFRFKKPAFVQLSDQEELCLSGRFEDCHIYQNRSNPAGSDIGRAPANPRSRRLIQRTLAGIVMLMLTILAALLWWPEVGFSVREVTAGAQPARSQQSAPVVPTRQAPAATATAEPAQEAALVAAKESTAEPVSPTAEPTAVPSPQPTATPAPPVDLAGLPDLFEVFQTSSGVAEKAPAPGLGFDSPIQYDENAAAPAVPVDLIILRPQPNLDSDVALSLSRREVLTLVGRDAASAWVKVRSESGLEGWVNARESNAESWAAGLPVISTAATTSEPVSVTTSLPVVSLSITLGNTALRSAPGDDYPELSRIDGGKIVGLLGTWHGGPWVRVRLDDGQEGWLNTDQLAGMS